MYTDFMGVLSVCGGYIVGKCVLLHVPYVRLQEISLDVCLH